jgi:Tfp pilus assembly protein PilF
MIRRTLPFLLILVLLPAGALLAQMTGTMFGQISDANGQPIEGVKIVITNPEAPSFRQEEISDERGRYSIFLTNAVPKYDFEFSKQGYRSINLSGFKIPATKRTRRNFDMRDADAPDENAAVGAADQPPPEASGGGYVETYNEGVAALDVGDLPTARLRFQESLEKQPEYGPAHGGLARVYWKQEQWADAAKWGESALALNPDDTEINQVLYAAYSGLGDKAKASEVLAKLKALNPEKAGKNMFNQGADLYNSGSIAEAKAIFEQILAVDSNQPKAHYMLGMCFVNEGNNAKAKEHLSKFVELAPNDPDAQLATEMMGYLD